MVLAVNYYCTDALFQIYLLWFWMLVMMLFFPVSTTTNGTVVVVAVVVTVAAVLRHYPHFVIFSLFCCHKFIIYQDHNNNNTDLVFSNPQHQDYNFYTVGVNIFPSKTVGILDDNFAFFCSDPSRTALSIQWLVNGTLLENSRLMNVFQEYNSRSKTTDLSFDLPLEHNVTTIQCIGIFASENVSSETITLLLQGQ